MHNGAFTLHTYIFKHTKEILFFSAAMVTHTFNPSTLVAEQVDHCEFETSLVYTGSLGPPGLHSMTQNRDVFLETYTKSDQPICNPRVTREQ